MRTHDAITDYAPTGLRRRGVLSVLLAVLTAGVLIFTVTGSSGGASKAIHSDAVKPTVVLVHGAWADGSSWSAVAANLQAKGYQVDVPPNTLRGPTEDAAYLASYLATISGPIVLVGHSYGGFVITNAATGNANVKALVYVDAFIPQAGDTLVGLNQGSCLSGNPTSTFNVVPYAGGEDLYIKPQADGSFEGFDKCFANGVPAAQAAVLAASQRPLSAAALAEPSGTPAWLSIPSWSVIGTEDHVITPAQQLFMSNRAHAHVVDVPAGHLSMITHPGQVADVIVDAANSVTSGG